MIDLTEQKRIKERNVRIASLTSQLAEERRNAIILSEVKLNIPKSSQAQAQEAGVELPTVVLATPSPKLDALTIHNDDMREPVGEFCGSLIRTVDTLATEVRTMRDTQNLVRLHTEALPNELLPHEEVCSDNLIRNKVVRRNQENPWVNRSQSNELEIHIDPTIDKDRLGFKSVNGYRVFARVDGVVVFTQGFNLHQEEEAQGVYDDLCKKLNFYTWHEYKDPENTTRVTIEEGRKALAVGSTVTFRPDGNVGPDEFALIHKELEEAIA
jgi:hypothetical protein